MSDSELTKPESALEDTCQSLAERAIELGAKDARVVDTSGIVFDDRSYLKCRFGCSRWGRYWTCPPHLAMTPEQFMSAFDKYEKAVIIQSADPQIGQEVTLAIEKEAMLVCGSMFAFAMVLCVKCDPCAYPDPCLYPHLARPSMDAYGVDIGKTLEPLGFKVTFDKQGALLPAWYSMVLL
jgi:predicted metal-binding protein